MPIMTIGTNNLEEQMAAMKGMLERLVEDSEEKEVQIKLKEKKIVRLTRKLERLLARSLTKGSESEEEERVFVRSEASDKKVHSNKGGKLKDDESPSLMAFEEIQDLIVNAVKAQLGGGARKTHLYTKPYPKRVDTLCMPRGNQPLNFGNLTGRVIRNSMWHISLRHITTMARMTIY